MRKSPIHEVKDKVISCWNNQSLKVTHSSHWSYAGLGGRYEAGTPTNRSQSHSNWEKQLTRAGDGEISVKRQNGDFLPMAFYRLLIELNWFCYTGESLTRAFQAGAGSTVCDICVFIWGILTWFTDISVIGKWSCVHTLLVVLLPKERQHIHSHPHQWLILPFEEESDTLWEVSVPSARDYQLWGHLPCPQRQASSVTACCYLT